MATPLELRHFPRFSRCRQCGCDRWKRLYRSSTGSIETRACLECGREYAVLPMLETIGPDGWSRYTV